MDPHLPPGTSQTVCDISLTSAPKRPQLYFNLLYVAAILRRLSFPNDFGTDHEVYRKILAIASEHLQIPYQCTSSELDIFQNQDIADYLKLSASLSTKDLPSAHLRLKEKDRGLAPSRLHGLEVEGY